MWFAKISRYLSGNLMTLAAVCLLTAFAGGGDGYGCIGF